MNSKLIKLIILNCCILSACDLKTNDQKKLIRSDTIVKQTGTLLRKNEQRSYIDQMTFIKYMDDGDYFQILARKGDSTFSFINDTDTTRNLNWGDPIQLKWKHDSITVAGDDESKMPAQVLLAIKKKGDGPVSRFRKTYRRKLKYTWATNEEFTSSYLDKIYLIVEYYLTQTKNPLLRLAVKSRDELIYSIESRTREEHGYTVIGIAPVVPSGANIVQWLYVDEEKDKLYEYDLPEDKLIAFK
jgi:hypothetical protein